MKILITGITGFAGRHLYDRLLGGQSKIYGIDKFIDNRNYFKEVTIYQGDITDEHFVKDVLTKVKPDQIYHLAAFVHVGRKDIEPHKMFNVNVAGTVNLLNAVKEIVPDTKILVTGSAEGYGKVSKKDMPIKEQEELRPENLYGLSKKFQEEAALFYYNTYNLNIVLTRTFHYFGPRQPLGFVFADFASQVVNIEKSNIDYIKVGNLKAQRDFTDIRDVVSAYEIIMGWGKCGEVYNVCSAAAISIEMILNKFLKHASKDIKTIVDEKKLRPTDVPIFIGDNQELRSLGWDKEYDLDISIRDVLDYWRKR